MYGFRYHKCIVKLPTATKKAESSLVTVLTAQRPVSDWLSSSQTQCCLLTPRGPSLPSSLTWVSDSLTAGVLLRTDESPSSFFAPYFRSRRFTRAQLLNDLRAKIVKGRFSRYLTLPQRCRRLFWWPPTTHSDSHTYIHIYIYIYMYVCVCVCKHTHECTILCHTGSCKYIGLIRSS